MRLATLLPVIVLTSTITRPALADSTPDVATPGTVLSTLNLLDGLFRGQSFRVNSDGLLTRVDGCLILTQPGPSPMVRWRLEGVTNDIPNGTVFASGTFTDVPETPTYIPLDVSVPVSEGDELALIMADDTPTQEVAWCGGVLYDDGIRVHETLGGWTAVGGTDLVLRAWVRGSVVDQTYTDVSLTPTAITNSLPAHAQTFTIGLDGKLSRITVNVNRGQSTADLLWEVREIGPLGFPNANIIATGTVLSADFPAGTNDVKLVLDPPLDVVAGEQLAIVLRSGLPDVPSFGWRSSTNAPYANGRGLVFTAGGWMVPSPARNFGFCTYVIPDECTCPCDRDGNGVVDIADLIMYLGAWFEGSPFANQNNDVETNISDLINFLGCWFDATGGDGCAGTT